MESQKGEGVKKFYAYLATLTLAVSGVLLFSFMNGESQAMPRDCDSNAIMKCGAANASELKNKYSKNATGDLDNIYRAYGISSSDVQNAGSLAKMGKVYKDGRVVVGGETVATGARSVGRHHMSGSSKKHIDGKTYYERSTGVSFGSSYITAFVFFDKNGEFRTAILTSCGNPVVAAPKPKPKPPVYACDGLQHTKISRTEYRFDASASAKNGASITGYTFDFGDGKKETTASKSITHTYAKEGTYTVKVTVNVKVDGKNKTVTDKKCEVRITVMPKPVTPKYVCDSLEQTKIGQNEYRFDGEATATGGAEVVGYTFDFGDGKQQATTEPTVTHTYEKEGTYTTKMMVTVKVNGENKTVTSESCVAQVTIVPPNKVQVCNPETGEIITVDEKDQDKYVPVGDKACQPVEECKPGIPVGDERCEPCPIPGKEHLPKNSPDCVETPVAELPKTGPMDLIGGTIGLGSMVTAAGYYAASRRNLLIELLKR